MKRIMRINLNAITHSEGGHARKDNTLKVLFLTKKK